MLINSIIIAAFVCSVRGEELELFSDGPVVLDAPITFTGVLRNTNPEDAYQWSWTDNASPVNHYYSNHNGSETKLNFTVVYPSSKYGQTVQTQYTMKLTIYKNIFYYWKNIIHKTIDFNLTSTLQGRLLVKQGGTQQEDMSGHSIVNSVNKTEIEVYFHDPSDFLKSASKIQYFWYIDAVYSGQTNKGVFPKNFSTPGNFQVETIIIADFNNSHREHNISTASWSLIEQRDKGVKTGLFHKRVISKDPISNFTVTGHKTLKHGQLVNLNIDCEGTGGWLFCWKTVEKGYNITGNETCDAPMYRKLCNFSIMWYFKNSDTYNLLVIVSNDVSSHLEVVSVTIHEAASQLPLSIVIIAVVAAICAVILLISGTNFKSNLAVEDDNELVFKSRRNWFVIEKFHLPPDLSEVVSRDQKDPKLKKKIDF